MPQPTQIPLWLPICTLAVAILALLRPEIEHFIRSRFTRIEFHPNGPLEVGFSDYGPTIAVRGTLRAIHHDQFVNSIGLRVVRKRDNATHNFDWLIFRPQKAIPKPEELELVNAFAVPVLAPRAVYVMCNDTETRSRYEGQLTTLKQAFSEFARSQGVVTAGMGADDARRLFEQYTNRADHPVAPIFAAIMREFYWEVGDYRLAVEVTTVPASSFSIELDFSLNAQQIEMLRSNSAAMTLAACFVPNVQFNFAYSKFRLVA